MAIAWKPKINKLWGQVEEEEEKVEELSAWERYDPFRKLGAMMAQPWTFTPEERQAFEEKGIEGYPAQLAEKWRMRGRGELGQGGESLTEMIQKAETQFAELPMWQQILWESPGYLAIPSAIAARAGLLARGGRVAEVAATALKPLAAIEALPIKAAEKIAKIKATRELTKELTHNLPHTDMGLKPKQQTKMVKEVATEATEWLGQVSKQKIKSPGEYAKEVAWASTALRDRLKGKVSPYIVKSSRPERLLEMMDGFKGDGKMWKIFYEPLDAAIQNALRKSIAGMDALTKLGDRIVPGKGIQALRDLGTQRIGVKLGKADLTRLDKIVINLYMRQKTAMSHLPHTYGLKSQSPKVFAQLQKIADSLTPEEKMIADTLGRIARFQQRATQDAFRYSYGKEMVLEPEWFPIKVLRGALSDIGWGMPSGMSQQNLAGVLFGRAFPSAKIAKGFTRPRTGKAIEALDRNIIEVLEGRMRDISYFSQVQPTIMDLQKLLGKSVPAKQLAVAIKQTHGSTVYKVLQKYLKDSASPRIALPTTDIEKTFRFLRQNAVVAVLGYNLVSAMKQFPSFVLGSTRTGYKPAMKGIVSYLRDPKRVDTLLKKLRPELYLRGKAFGAGIEREMVEITEARVMARGAAKVYWTVKDTAMAIIRATDKLAVRGLWIGAFDDAVQKGMTQPQAAAYASKIIRQTQPYFSAKDLAHYWRGGEMAKMLTIFTNQLNQNFNYIAYDIIGPYRAGVIGKTKVLERVMMGIVAQGLMIGAISRSRPAKDLAEIRDDLSWQGLAMMPLGGSLASSAIKGFTGSNVVSLEALAAMQDTIYAANKLEWDKLGKASLKAGAYGAGIPYSQPKRTGEGILDLATGKTDDWMRLIWSEWAREQALDEPAFQFTPLEPRIGGAEGLGEFGKLAETIRGQVPVAPVEREQRTGTGEFSKLAESIRK